MKAVEVKEQYVLVLRMLLVSQRCTIFTAHIISPLHWKGSISSNSVGFVPVRSLHDALLPLLKYHSFIHLVACLTEFDGSCN